MWQAGFRRGRHPEGIVKSTDCNRLVIFRLLVAVLALSLMAAVSGYAQEEEKDEYELIYVPTPQDIVDEMLKLADVGKDDVFFDLGCGDGRLVVSAAKLGARGVGVDLSPERIKEANENAAAAGVTDKVQFLRQDIMEADIRSATLIGLYLLPVTMDRLYRKLLRELKPGTRIVSHNYQFSEWPPEKEISLEGHTLYFWRVPEASAEKPAARR